ncbi:fasciclin domain-containing protein [Sphingobacterium sp. N143]|uniref:fasciclin domain-containing protein n=1 Tax=Sphingobacterium sp. N143 TaxID=2746727 RepID=UPI002574BEC7|nr:fasciclin domain-containing protein [Sphingobacterium sp. N143]MDM1295401.1 fasciclin domain-containing protein [Sphingobacterium sp. N143]
MRKNQFVRCIYTILTLVLLYACAKDKGYYSPISQEPVYKGNLYSYLKSKPGVYDSLVKVIDRIGLQKKLEDSTVTLFALTNANFQLAIQNLNNTLSVSDKPAQYLNSVKYEILDSLMCQYIIQGWIGSDSLLNQDGQDVLGIRYGYPMHIGLNRQASSGYLNGGPTIVDFSDTRRSVFNRNWVTTETSSLNIQTDNAIVHVLNPDHVFGFNKFVSQIIYIPPPENLFKTMKGVGTASLETPGGPDGVEASKYVFDGNPETKFFLSNPGRFYLQWEFPVAVAANSYTLRSANDIQERDPTDWTLQGWNEEKNDWDLLDTKKDEAFDERFQLRVFFFKNTKPYKIYRFNIARMYGGNDFQLADWTMNRDQ